MATTIAAAWVVGRRLYTATVGDSRIYLMLDGRLHQASIDHTWVEDAVERGLLTREQARYHPNAHVLRRHLGSMQDPEPDQRLRLGEEDTASAVHQGLELKDGDAVVLCSDGLSDLVEADEIQDALRHKRLDQSVKELIDLARKRGGHDNITVAVLRMSGKGSGASGRKWLRRIFVLAMLVLVFAGLGLLYLFWKSPGLF
jgi:PPM family protein phosphatase